jgi:hypothetical protein
MYKGKGAFLGSGFLPPNAYVTLDCEFILLFRKGKLRKFPPKDALRYDGVFTKKERDEWFSQIWSLKGTRQTVTDLERRTAAYPEEIANRLIRMFSVKVNGPRSILRFRNNNKNRNSKPEEQYRIRNRLKPVTLLQKRRISLKMQMLR